MCFGGEFLELVARIKHVGIYPQRIKNCDSLGNCEVNLFDLRDVDKFQEFKSGLTLCMFGFCLLIVELCMMR